MLRLTAESISGASADLDVAAARRVVDHQLEVDKLIGVLRERYPEQYADAYSVGAGGSSVIMVKGDASLDLAALVGSYKDVVLVDGLRFGRDELISMARGLWGAYNESGYVVTAQVSVRDQQVTIRAATSPLTEPIGIDAALARVEETAPAVVRGFSRSDIAFEIVPAEQLAVTETWAYGGDKLKNGVNLKCTSAFSVKRNGLNKWGILTAEHCTDITDYNGYQHVGGNTHNTKRRFGHYGAFGDYMYRSTSGTERDDFYFNNTQKADVASVMPFSQIGVGDWLCRYGRATGGLNKCAQVNNVLIMTSAGVGVTRTNSTGLDDGDSGGPWYFGSIAVGITHGYVTATLDDTFSSVEIAEDILNVSVMTQ